jgi:beta-glucosidase
VIERLTLEEKAALCLGSDMWHTTPIPRLGIPAIMVSDGPHGLRRKPDDADPSGISGSLPATCFPTASALGSSWDPRLIFQIGQAIGVEARAQGVAVVLGPGINIKRSPLCGRNFEYFSEDPILSGVLGAALVEGIQSQGVGACVKHFAANNQETDRVRVSAEVDERTLREIYLPAFERVVTQARPWMVMCAYNRVNGVWASQNPWLLTEILRHEWGYAGVVVSDWGAVHDRVAALAAGLDLEMPPNHGVSDAAIVTAVRDGSLDEAVLDRSVGRVLELAEKARQATEIREFDADAHHALARVAACESAVLLKNQDGILPLRPAAGDMIAVIGEFARTPRFQGAGSSQVNPTRVDIPLDEIRKAAPAGVQIDYADALMVAEAVDLARRAATAVVFLGLPPAAESEGFDRSHMNLPDSQTALLAKLATVNPNLVVVLSNGSAVHLSDWQQHAKAILECWLSGQAAGGAIADLLWGKANPSGRLAETLPVRPQDNPSYLNFPGEAGHVRYGEGIFVGYRGFDSLDRDVAYPFGHGLSYTTFRYTDLRVDDDLAVSCTLTNTGSRAGKEVVQLYVGDSQAQVARPARELKAFTKIGLEPGQSATVTFQLAARDLSYWSPTRQCWVLEGGTFEIAVGASSRDLRLIATVEIDAPPLMVPLDGMATLHEWLADPQGETLIRQAIGVDGEGRPRGILANDELATVIGDFPISTLATFPGTGLDHLTVAELTRQVQPRRPT